jgi:transposase
MTKRERRVFTEEFKREAVHLIETSGRTIAQIAQIADDLGVGLSTLTHP